MVAAAQQMLKTAQVARADLVIPTDFSAACGAQVIYSGPRSERVYQKGSGVCAALLDRNGFSFIGHKDLKTISHLIARLDPSFEIDSSLFEYE